LTFAGENYEVSWSFSDTIIAFRHDIGDYPGIWLMDKNGNRVRPFIKNSGHLDFAPGDSLFYEISIGQSLGQLRMMNISDSTSRLICVVVTDKPYRTYYDPDVSHDGKTIAFSIDSQIRIISSEGGDIITLTAKRRRIHPGRLMINILSIAKRTRLADH